MTERWSDLWVRLASALVLAAIALAAAWGGTVSFVCLVVLLVGGALWELSRMHAPRSPSMSYAVAVLGAGVSIPIWTFLREGETFPFGFYILELAVFSLFVMVLHRRDKLAAGLYAFAVVGAGAILGSLYAYPAWLILLLGTVIVTDLAGYFCGRALGGPKFWPSISPKKTWSGILGGWVGAAILSYALVQAWALPLWTIALGVVMSFCSQMGDIAESAMKRRAGIKDSSNLIPGHGGVLDRFDGVIGATLAMLIWIALVGL